MDLPVVDETDTDTASSWLTTEDDDDSEEDSSEEDSSEEDSSEEDDVISDDDDRNPSSEISMETDDSRSSTVRTRQAAMVAAMSVIQAVEESNEAHKESMMGLLSKLDDMDNLLTNPYLKAAMWDVKECALNIMLNL